MADNTGLAWTGIIRHDHEHRIGARLLGLFHHAHGVCGVVGACAGNHRHIHDFLDRANEVNLLIHVSDRRFTGRAVDDQAVCAIRDKLLGQFLRRKDTAERSRVQKVHVTLTHS